MGKILVLLALTLAGANAYCFERCLIQPPDSAPPCHAHSKPVLSHWAEPHNLNAAAVRVDQPTAVAVHSAGAITPALPIRPRIDRSGEAPPGPDLAATVLPLRI